MENKCEYCGENLYGIGLWNVIKHYDECEKVPDINGYHWSSKTSREIKEFGKESENKILYQENPAQDEIKNKLLIERRKNLAKAIFEDSIMENANAERMKEWIDAYMKENVNEQIKKAK